MREGSVHPDGRITTEKTGQVFLIGIDRPKKLNGFSPKMLTEMAEAFTAFERDDEARVGLLFAEGPNFTAGLELDKVAPVMRERGSVYPLGSVDPLSLRPPIRTKPVVCAVQGICFTLGIELMLAADIAVAADDCRFAQLEVKRGLMAAGGATIRMVARAGWGNAQRYLLTGDEFSSAEAFRLGFVQEVVPTGRQKERALEIAGTIAKQAPLAVRATLASSLISLVHGPHAAIREFAGQQTKLLGTQDAAEGVRSFMERRKAGLSAVDGTARPSRSCHSGKASLHRAAGSLGASRRHNDKITAGCVAIKKTPLKHCRAA